MVRRIAALVLILLAGCATPTALSPTASPPPTPLVLPTLPPAGATILASDFGKARPTLDPTTAASLPTPLPTDPPPPTPVAAGFDFALRGEFSKELNKIENKTFYSIQWELNDDLSELRGTQRVGFANRTKQPLDAIYFRLFANANKGEGQIRIDRVAVGSLRVFTELQNDETVLKVWWGDQLEPGRLAVLNLEYTIQIPREAKGRYSDFTRTDWLTTLPTVYPIIPAIDDKGWHLETPPEFGDLLYADSSTYDVTIIAPVQYTVITTGELVQEIRSGNRIRRRFIAAPVRDFDVNITNTLVKSSAPMDGVTVNSWSKPEEAEAGKRVLDWTVNALRVYEKRFGPYPFKTLDVVESPTTAGGIEYPGVITIASNLYADPGQLNFFEFATAHETAHQWFYSTVGNDQVNQPWQDEALVQYVTLVYFEDRYGKETAERLRSEFFEKQYEAAKQKYGDLPAGLPVGAYDEEAYGAFVYAKGPLFFQAVREFIGDQAFFRALQNYYQQFKYANAQPQDLINAFNQASGKDITPLYSKWIAGQ
ncbi:MAG: M1 family metallopeptidase [Chloroflexi bacterium]|nr:M1 family metallopeptidase [Chloroflexota bacterium]